MTSSTITADLTHSDSVSLVPTRDSRLRQRPPFGLSRRVWIFIKVFLAASFSCLAAYATAQYALQWQPASWEVADRLALVAKTAPLAVLPMLIAIAVVAAQRLSPKHFIGEKVKRNSALDINVRFIQNTFEQFIVFLAGNAALAVYLLPVDANSVPLLAAMFLIGRVLYWWGYHYNTYVRSYGFGITFYPTVAVYAWLALYATTGIYVSI